MMFLYPVHKIDLGYIGEGMNVRKLEVYKPVNDYK